MMPVPPSGKPSCRTRMSSAQQQCLDHALVCGALITLGASRGVTVSYNHHSDLWIG